MIARIISALILGFSSACAVAQAPDPIRINPQAPDRHVVVRGDTLWGIAGKFMQDPWRWPEIWRLNRSEIRNPHRIYPGQVVILDASGGSPRLRLAEPVKLEPKVYSEASTEPVPSIPPQVIEPFLSEPLVVEAGGLDSAPKIVATQEGRLYLGQGNLAYVSGIRQEAKLWQVYRPAKPLLDPVSGEVLGHEAFYLGSARVVRPGEPATLEITSARQEIGAGDRLVPLVRTQIPTYAPHAPEKAVDGRVVAIYAGVNVGETARNYVVTVNLGRRDGMELGHVLALHRGAQEVTYKGEQGNEVHRLPRERYGLAFVFRTFERLSYALVMDASRPVHPNDAVTKP
ncbi:MAG: LysM peptidoglycan-binding domain-containing protein [Rhodocyclaceae bacterium]